MNEIADTGLPALPATQSDVAALFAAPDQVEALIGRIEQEVRSHAPDLTTAKGRKAVASLASKVSRSKTALDEAGKNLNAGLREKINVVDAERRKLRERLDALRDEARKPLTDWEKAEEARKSLIEAQVRKITPVPFTGMSPSADIAARIESITALVIDDSWGEFQEEAAFAKDTTLAQLRQALDAAKHREEQAAELERLRAAEAERIRKEAVETAAREKAEREEREAAEAKAAEARRAAEMEAQREAAARQAREKAERAAAEEKARHERELAAAKRAAEEAAERERERIASEKRAEEEAAAKRAADQKRREEIRSQIIDAIDALPDQSALGVANAIINGEIPNVAASF